MKYIVCRARVTESLCREMIFVFPSSIVHEYFGAVAKILIEEHGWTLEEHVSAGEISSLGQCGGRSDSMDLDSRGDEDTALFMMQDYGGGIICD